MYFDRYSNTFTILLQIYGWIPKIYNSTKLPDSMPDSLKKYINDSSMPQKKKDGMVWFSCEGENPADVEHIGEIGNVKQSNFEISR